MKNANLFKAILISTLLGILIIKWKWISSFVGIDIQVPLSDSIVSYEYYVGLPVAIILGFSFPKYPTHCGIWLMLGPILINHTIFIVKHGVPNMWPVELLLLTFLAVPYVVLSHVGSFIERRLKGVKDSITRDNN